MLYETDLQHDAHVVTAINTTADYVGALHRIAHAAAQRGNTRLVSHLRREARGETQRLASIDPDAALGVATIAKSNIEDVAMYLRSLASMQMVAPAARSALLKAVSLIGGR